MNERWLINALKVCGIAMGAAVALKIARVGRIAGSQGGMAGRQVSFRVRNKVQSRIEAGVRPRTRNGVPLRWFARKEAPQNLRIVPASLDALHLTAIKLLYQQV